MDELTNWEINGRLRTLKPHSTIGIQDTDTCGVPMSVNVSVLRNGGSGVSCNLRRTVPTKLLSSAQMAISRDL